MPIGSLHILHFKERRRRQQHIRIVRGVGEKLLMHHGEQVLAHHPAQDIVLVRSHRGRIRVIDKHRLHRRPVFRIIAKRGQRLPQQAHIHHSRRPPQRTRLHQLRHLQRITVERKRPRSRELQSAALVPPSSSQQWQHAHRSHCCTTVLTPLYPVVQPNRCRSLRSSSTRH